MKKIFFKENAKLLEFMKKIERIWKSKMLKIILVCLLFEFVVVGITTPVLVFYGPFTKVRNTVVTTAMATFNHQYIATTFLSDKKIEEIMGEEAKQIAQTNEEVTQTAPESVVINNKNISDEIEKIDITGRKFKGYALIIHNPAKVKVGVSSKIGIEGQTTSAIAKSYNALAAINGGGFQDISPDGKAGSGIGALPNGLVMTGGKVIYPVDKSDSTEYQCVMAIDSDGKMIVGGPYSIKTLKELKVKEALSFAPTLIVGGKPYISESTLQGANPRTAIGQREDGSIIFLAIDGRQGIYLGATLKDVQEVMQDLKAVNAMCLDGGSSTTMYYNKEVINSPSNMLGERSIPTVVYVEP
jgi:exopolysaccharide biosynthesis protein